MNAAALRQVVAHWPTVLSALSAATGPNAGDAWLATSRLRWMPLALPEPLPEGVAATFKTVLGLHRPLTAWLLGTPGASSRPLAELVRPLSRLDDEGWLVGAHQACAAPPARIQDAWDALGSPIASELPPGAEFGERCAWIVAGTWAILGATRQVLRSGSDEAPTWSPVGPVDPDWPVVLRLLRKDGPGALVREVPTFDPTWVRDLHPALPPRVATSIEAAERAVGARSPLAALGEVWERLAAF